MKETEKYEEQLRRMQASSPFKVPDGYFEELPGSIQKSIDLIEGKKTAGNNPFTTPENYFSNLPGVISEKVKSKTAFKPIFSRPDVLIPLACAILVIGFFLFTNKPANESSQYYTIDEIENSTYLQTIDEDLLIEELASIPVVVTPSDSLTQYILDNNIELSDLEYAL